MIIDSKSGLRGMLVNAETGQPIRFASWANLYTGEYVAFLDPPGHPGRHDPTRRIHGKVNRLSFVESYAPPVRVPSAVDAKAAMQEVEEYRRTISPILLLVGDECEYPGCHKYAEWNVAFEKLLEPVRQADGALHERGVIVAVHNYCPMHYRHPVTISERGVESECIVGARPLELTR